VSEPTPTQVRRPWRATVRTIIQVGIPAVLALGLVVPEVVRIILEETGDAMPDQLRVILLGISAAVVATAAILTRIMAIPQVEDFLRRHRLLSGLAADKDQAGYAVPRLLVVVVLVAIAVLLLAALV
jgi:hypothetical protein